MTALYALPPWLVLLVAVALAVTLACAGHVAVRRAFPRIDFRLHNDVGGIVLGVVGGLFAVMLAFIVAIVWQEFDAATQRVAVEVGAATDLWHTSRGLPAPLGPSVRTNLIAYATAMVDDEWPAMRTGGRSKRAENVLTRTFEDVAQFRPANAGASNAQAASLQYLGALHDARHHRFDDNASGVSAFEWTILLIGALVVIGICYLVGLSSLRAQLLMTAAVAAMIAATFVLIFELDYPFRGDLSIEPAGWHEFLTANR
ncbi:MAG: hypothetical protein QOF71_3595 [Candidatus Eremiobacteraeota bacterium]|jgi:hypothetical protein|nr:hypothetical protein [Candidatus Eremiobacteraeota bacterium]